jgi:hypothetical protein
MTVRLFVALYVRLIVSMIVLFIANFPLGWIFFGFLFVAVFGGMLVADRPYLIAAGFLVTSLIVLGVGLLAMQQAWQTNTWPTAPGVITRSQYCTRTTNGLEVYRGRCIDYRYRVADQTFDAGTIETGQYARGGPLSLPDNFQAGQDVKVH